MNQKDTSCFCIALRNGGSLMSARLLSCVEHAVIPFIIAFAVAFLHLNIPDTNSNIRHKASSRVLFLLGKASFPFLVCVQTLRRAAGSTCLIVSFILEACKDAGSHYHRKFPVRPSVYRSLHDLFQPYRLLEIDLAFATKFSEVMSSVGP